jgi:hypothetical protein
MLHRVAHHVIIILNGIRGSKASDARKNMNESPRESGPFGQGIIPSGFLIGVTDIIIKEEKENYNERTENRADLGT